VARPVMSALTFAVLGVVVSACSGTPMPHPSLTPTAGVLRGHVLGSGGPPPGTVIPLAATDTIRTLPGDLLVRTLTLGPAVEFAEHVPPGSYRVQVDCGGVHDVDVKPAQTQDVTLLCGIP
jgi:hypothetical protein